MDRECKLNVYKTLRRRPGGILDVLSTFTLRSVSSGIVKDLQKTAMDISRKKNSYATWPAWENISGVSGSKKVMQFSEPYCSRKQFKYYVNILLETKKHC